MSIYTTLLILIISMIYVFGNDVPTMSPIIRQTMSPTISVTQTMSPTVSVTQTMSPTVSVTHSNLRTSGYRPSRISSEDEDEANNKYTSGTKVGIIIASISVSILVFICILCICLKFF